MSGITGRVTGEIIEIKQAETMLLVGEVGAIEFSIDTGQNELTLLALETDGTAFHTLQNDARFRPGERVIAFLKGARCVGLRLDTADVSKTKTKETDIAKLKDRAMRNLHMAIGDCYALLNAFDANSVQAYAIALHLKQRGERTDQVLSIADQDAVCNSCKSTLHISPRRAYAFSDNFCNSCNANVKFTLREPLPRERDEARENLSWQEVQERIKAKFGGQ